MDISTDLGDSIKACRTCGIHYVTPSKNQLKHLFRSCQEHSEIMLIRLELSQWSVEVAENDGFPQYICNTCIHKFEQVFQLRTACINAQNEFRKFYAVSNGNISNIKIKSEVPDTDEEPAICDFIYVDELSDGEYDSVTPFNIPHIPIKEEIIEAAAVPMEDSEQSLNVVESASRVSLPSDLPCSLTTDYIPQNVSMADSQPDAVLPITLDAVECNLCNQISSDRDEHKQHMKNVHDVRDIECHVCGKEFKNCTSARIKFHMKWHTLSKQVKCNLCTFVCKSKDALNSHKRMNHRKMNCKICGKVVLAKKLKSHLHQHELQVKYSCEYCTEAFATENERENHIWQIHANEDNSASCTHRINEDSFNVPQGKNMYQDTQENILFKFICAHCESRFMEQVDLESHVQVEHREVNFKPKTASIAKQIEKTESIQNHNEHAVFEKYDNDNEIQVTNNSANFTQGLLSPTSLDFVKHSENTQKDETEMASSSSFDINSVASVSENSTNNLSTYVGGSLSTFACAKCSETFVSIEQLRDHHEKHLATEHQQQTTSLTKSKFQCNLCEKSFDLKFRLNRHMNKHKNNAPF